MERGPSRLLKRLIVGTFAVPVILGGGLVAGCGGHEPAGQGSAASQTEPAAKASRRVLYYRNPMNASITSPVPAKDQMGMAYVPVYADEAEPAIQVSDSVARRMGLRTVPVAFGPLNAEVRATGVVRTNEHSVREVRVRAEGWIEKLSVRAAGDAVRAGEPLLQLYSPRLETAEQEFVNSLGFDDKNRQAVAERRLSDLGLEPAFIASLRETRSIPHLIPFHVPVDGVVTELSAREGSYMEPTSMFVMRIASLDPAWVVLDVPEFAKADIAVGNSATLSANAYPGRKFEGRVDYVYPELDPSSRTIRVRIVVPNKGAPLLPNMYVSAMLAGTAGEAVVHVPRDAVIRDGSSADSARVLVALGEGRYEPRAVQLGREVGDELVIVSGLTQADRVVTSAVFLLDSEASLNAGLARLQH